MKKVFFVFCLGLMAFLSNPVSTNATEVNLNYESLQNSQRVTFHVVDENGNPIPGVTIRIKGTTTGVVTDGDGKAELDVPYGATLEISYIGYRTQEVVFNGMTSFNIVLQPDGEGFRLR